MYKWIRQQWKAVIVAMFFMFLTLGFLFAGVGCNAVSGLARDVGAMSDGIARAYSDSSKKQE
jgi:hypothetical protein